MNPLLPHGKRISGIQQTYHLKLTPKKPPRVQFSRPGRRPDSLLSNPVVWSPMVLSRRKGGVEKRTECTANTSTDWNGFRDEAAEREGPSTNIWVILSRMGKVRYCGDIFGLGERKRRK